MSAVYHISRGYRQCIVWEGNKDGQRFCVHKTTPNKNHTRQEKYEIISKFLTTRFGLPRPEYIPLSRQREIDSIRRQAGKFTT